jgi:glycerate dehydrogenase
MNDGKKRETLFANRLILTITDGYTLNPGDLSWEPLQQFGTVHYFDRTRSEDILGRVKSSSIIITNKTPLSREVILSCPNLKMIAVTATGYNVIDMDAARARGVVVCNVPGYGTDSVAQHTFALILELTNHVGRNAASVTNGEWSSIEDFCYTKGPVVELAGKTLGIVGFGKIGRAVAEIGRAFGMHIIYSSRSVGSVSIDELFFQSDFISLHCPLTKDNERFVNASLIGKMKSGAFLINTARGQLIDEQALAQALQNKTIGGAALDVLSAEPPPRDHPLIGLPNCIVTPHNAWYSREARQRILDTTVRNIEAALKGTPINCVN